jgi:hypothetical protein
MGLPLEALELLDPAIRQALFEGRLEAEELPELVGWFDEDTNCHGPKTPGTAGRDIGEAGEESAGRSKWPWRTSV